MLRLFIAIPLPPLQRSALAMLCSGVPGARWSAPENFHLTLRFIGDVDETVFSDVANMLSTVSGEPFELALTGVGHFGDRRRAHVIWAGVSVSEPLRRLQSRIETTLQRIGLEPERRKYSPHVTLARLKGAPMHRVHSFLADHAGFATLPFTVDRFVLFSSHLGRAGAIHTVEAEYDLLPLASTQTGA